MPNAEVYYLDTGLDLTVQWRGVRLATNVSAGGFDFQLTLKRSGEISFYYQTLPVDVDAIVAQDVGNGEHPVEVGLANAYQRTYEVDGNRIVVHYRYHSVSVSRAHVQHGTVVVFEPLPCTLLASGRNDLQGIQGNEVRL